MKITRRRVALGERIPIFYLVSKYEIDTDIYYCDIFYIAIPKIIYYKLNLYYHKIFRYESLMLEYTHYYKQGYMKGLNTYDHNKEREIITLKNKIMKMEMLIYSLLNPRDKE